MFDFNTETGLIRMYGIISPYGHDEDFPGEISPTDLMKAFDAMGGRDVVILLKSEGGEISSGLSMYNQIEAYDGKVTVEVDAQAASIATVFPMAADQVLMRRRSEMFIHDPWTIAMGNSAEFRGVADYLDALALEIADVYAEKAGGTAESWFNRMRETERFNAQQAVDAGLADGIVGNVSPHKKPGQPGDKLVKAPVAQMNWTAGNSLDMRRRLRKTRN